MKLRLLLSERTMLLSAIAAVAQISGSVQTILPTGAKVQGNIYPSKEQVFLTAGPQNQKASGLPDGRYYFQVTDPNGSALLSDDPAACRQVVVGSGRLAGAYDPVTQSLEPAGTPLDTSNCEHASAAPAAGVALVQLGGAFHACAIGASSPDIFCNTPNTGGDRLGELTVGVPTSATESYSTPGACPVNYNELAQWSVSYGGDANNAAQTTTHSMLVNL